MRLFVVFCFICAFACAAVAQNGGKIRGSVRFTDGSIAGAVTVTATPKNGKVPLYSVTTNANGEFVIESVVPGEYSINATLTANGILRGSGPVPPVSSRVSLP